MGNTNIKKLLKSTVLLSVALCAVACGGGKGSNNEPSATSSNGNGNASSLVADSSSAGTSVSVSTEHVDYVSQLKLDLTTTSLKKVVTVKTFIDGDTTHFNMPDDSYGSSVIKARYLSVNTPESTGKIEPWGKKASNFTHQTLEAAESIMIESDDENYNTDSTGGRCLLWVWYRTSATSDYRCLNLELLQEGYAIASNSGNNRYGEVCLKAIAQAKAEKLRVYDPKGDPDFYTGGPIEVSLKELRAHLSTYDGTQVSFHGNVVRNYSNGVYVEEYQDDINQYCGMYVYYGFNTNGNVLSALTVGNEVRVVGTVSSFNGTYQVSGLDYDMWEPEKNTFKTGEGKEAGYPLVSATTFTSDVKVEFEDTDADGNETIKEETFKYSYLAVNTTIRMNDLKINFISTTESETSSNGAMTFTCSSEGKSIKVRTEVLKDESGRTLTEADFTGKTINVKGVVDYYNSAAQIKVFNYSDITVK